MTVLRFGHPVAELRALVQRQAPPADLAAAAAALASVRRDRSEEALGLLIPLLRHPDAAVRVGACRGLGGHPFPRAESALFDIRRGDPSSEVRTAADAALEAHEAAPMQCLVCGRRATLTPETASNPHGVQLVYPVFCSEKCAISFALTTARDDFHRCAPDGTWHAGPAESCGACQDLQGVGPELPPRSAVAADLAAAAKKSTRPRNSRRRRVDSSS